MAAWLHDLGFDQYQSAFEQNAIDADVLCRLSADDLKELGVAALGHRRKILDAIARLRELGSTQIASTQGVDSSRELRHVVVVFADLSGFTSLSRALDPEALVVLLNRYFQSVDGHVVQHGGHIDKHVGDCVMAVFGAPRSYGNDAERALHAAVAIRDAMPALSRDVGQTLDVHIGIASGQVVASGTGSDAHREYTVTGDTVNLASRLTDAARAGEILIAERVRNPLADRLECEPHGEFDVKGFDVPVRAWRLLALRAPAQISPFVGRDAELMQFHAVLTACAESSRGHIVYLRGEAGIGKTRLLDEFRRHARDEGYACFDGWVLDFGSRTGHDAVRSLVRGMLMQHDEGNAVKHAIERGWIGADDGLFLNDLLDVPQTIEQRAMFDAMDHATRLIRRRRVMSALLDHSSRLEPRMLSVEDIHWADKPILDDLASLATTVANCRAVLVMTSRLEGDPLDSRWRHATGAPYSIFDLGPLPTRDAQRIASAFAGVPTESATHCIDRAAGNPLFLDQLLREASSAYDRYVADAIVPGSIQSVVQARMDRLVASDKSVLQAASILGQRFEREAVAALMDATSNATESDTDEALDRLSRELLLRPQGDAYLFHHALIRDAVYDTVLPSRRRSLHARAAAWFASRDTVLQAEHLDRAADPRAPWAYAQAARKQAQAYHDDVALKLVSRGLALAVDDERFELTRLRGDILLDLGDTHAALAAFEDAARIADTDAQRCQAWIGLATVKRVIEDGSGAWSDLDRAERIAGEQGLEREAARIHFLRGNLCFPRADIEGCVREHTLSLDISRRIADPEQEAAALGGLGDGEYMRGRMVSAHRAFAACISLSRLHGFGRIEVANLPMLAITAWFAGEGRQALDIACKGVVSAQRVGHRRALAVAHHCAYHCWRDLAQWDQAWKEVTPALRLAREINARRFEAEALGYRAELYRVEGNRGAALADIEAALAISEETGMAYMGAFYYGVLARVTDDLAVSEQALSKGEALLAAGAVSHNHPLFRREAIETCLAWGHWDAVLSHADALTQYMRIEPTPFTTLIAERAYALVAYRRGRREIALRAEFERLKRAANDMGFVGAMQALDDATSHWDTVTR